MQGLRREVNERMSKLEQNPGKFEWLYTQSYPPNVGMAAVHLCSLFDSAVDSMTVHKKYQTLFGPSGNMLVTLDAPNTASMDKNSNCAPEKIMYVDWELAFPSVRIECFHCNEICSNTVDNSSAAPHFLARDMTNFAKSKSLFPIWTIAGMNIWCVIMNYRCSFCHFSCAGNDGKLLSVLPPEIAGRYPVVPEDAYGGDLHLHKEIGSDYFEFGDSSFSKLFEKTEETPCTVATTTAIPVGMNKNMNVAMTAIAARPVLAQSWIAPWSYGEAQWRYRHFPVSHIPYCDWLPRPVDCCYEDENGFKFLCAAYFKYVKTGANKKRGRRPHDSTCPIRHGLPCWYGQFLTSSKPIYHI
jgi:hypothetical protein